MRLHQVLLVPFWLLLGTAADAADLSKIDRSIAKEPAYKSKAPKYGLLVFGAEAKTRVWLVLDGDDLYVDRNGNGDLTEEGEHLTAEVDKPNGGEAPIERQSYKQVEVSAPDGKKYTLSVEQYRFKQEHMVKLLAQMPEEARAFIQGFEGQALIARLVQGAHGGQQAACRPAARPQDASVISFEGALHMATERGIPPVLRRGIKPSDLQVCIGTPGLGHGTFASIFYDRVPKDVHPVADIEFPSREPAKMKPLQVRVVLNQRC